MDFIAVIGSNTTTAEDFNTSCLTLFQSSKHKINFKKGPKLHCGEVYQAVLKDAFYPTARKYTVF